MQAPAATDAACNGALALSSARRAMSAVPDRFHAGKEAVVPPNCINEKSVWALFWKSTCPLAGLVRIDCPLQIKRPVEPIVADAPAKKLPVIDKPPLRESFI